jgi:hypothetical protein
MWEARKQIFYTVISDVNAIGSSKFQAVHPDSSTPRVMCLFRFGSESLPTEWYHIYSMYSIVTVNKVI